MSRKKKMTLLIFGIILIIIAIAGGVWWFMMMGRPNPSLPEERLVVGSSAFTVEIASTTLQKMTGLSFRTALAPDHGMLFTFGAAAVQNFWMKDMNFAIDMIWIGGGKSLDSRKMPCRRRALSFGSSRSIHRRTEPTRCWRCPPAPWPRTLST